MPKNYNDDLNVVNDSTKDYAERLEAFRHCKEALLKEFNAKKDAWNESDRQKARELAEAYNEFIKKHIDESLARLRRGNLLWGVINGLLFFASVAAGIVYTAGASLLWLIGAGIGAAFIGFFSSGVGPENLVRKLKRRTKIGRGYDFNLPPTESYSFFLCFLLQ